MLDCSLYGRNPAGHHLTNVLLHAATAVLLFLVLRRMTGRMWPSALVAAVFAIHPLRAESVAWVTERKDVLAGLFFRADAVGLRRLRAAAVLARRGTLAVAALLTMGLLSKSILVTLPCLLLLLDWWPLGRRSRKPRPGSRPIPQSRDRRSRSTPESRSHFRASGRGFLGRKAPAAS